MFGAAFAIDPARIAVGIVLFFPDRQSHFHLVDDVTAGNECLIPVRGRDADPDGTFTDFEHAGAMHAMGMKDSELCPGLSNYFLTLGDGQRLVYFVFESLNRMAFVLVPDPAFKTGIGTGCGIEEFAPQNGRVDGFVSNPDHISHRLRVEITGRYRHR